MYARGSFSGPFQEYPEPSGAGEVVYDGYGNAVGFLPGLPNPLAKLAQRFLPQGGPFRRFPPPVGWVTPALPYTGRAPRRLYMRCSVWPGPAGLVPAGAQQPPFPGALPPGAIPPGAVPPGAQAFRRRRFRRRRR